MRRDRRSHQPQVVERGAGGGEPGRCLDEVGTGRLDQPAVGGYVVPFREQDDIARYQVLCRQAAGGAFPQPIPGLPGIPTDGGFQTVDASSHSARADAADEFMFRDGPTHRTVVEARSDATRAESIWPGGTSGALGSPNYFQFLERWLANESMRLSLGREQVEPNTAVSEKFRPAMSH